MWDISMGMPTSKSGSEQFGHIMTASMSLLLPLACTWQNGAWEKKAVVCLCIRFCPRSPEDSQKPDSVSHGRHLSTHWFYFLLCKTNQESNFRHPFLILICFRETRPKKDIKTRSYCCTQLSHRDTDWNGGILCNDYWVNMVVGWLLMWGAAEIFLLPHKCISFKHYETKQGGKFYLFPT